VSPVTARERFEAWAKDRMGGFTGDLRFDEPLSKHTYYRIGGPAAAFAFPKTLDDLRWLAEGVQATGIPHFVLGSGSNLLVADDGYDGLVIRATRVNLELGAVSEEGSTVRVRSGGSVAVSTFLRRAATEGWAGLELLAGIPGSVGGVVAMNAGTHLGEAKDRLTRVEVFDFASASGLRVFEAADLRFEYRRNLFLPKGCVVWSAEWLVKRADPATVKASIDETLARRKASQPIDYPSCGSVFKNPRESGLRAWQVIDKLGLRGHRVGDAQFSEKHPNFIINLDAARAADVRALITLAKERARTELGVELEEEVMYLCVSNRAD
jgi:UDP-N-acetylmuramate dehydrogenase